MRRSDQRRAAVVALYQADLTDRSAPDLLDARAPEFARELVEGVERDRGRDRRADRALLRGLDA